MRQIGVSSGNPALYTQNDVLFIRKPDGSAAAVTYFGEESAVTLPPDTTELYPEAFVNSNVEQVNLPLSVSSIGEKAFVGCGALRRLRFGVTDSSGARKSAVVYFPAVDNNGDYWGNTIRDQLMDCIRTGIDGDILDFEKYDSLFESIVMIQDKILVAIDRLKSPLGLASVYGANYRRFLTERKEQSVTVCIRFDDTEGLNLLAELTLWVDDLTFGLETSDLRVSEKKTEDRHRTYITKNYAILQHFTQPNATTRKNGKKPVTATVYNLTQPYEKPPNLLASLCLITRRSLVQVLLPQPFRVFITDLSYGHSLSL